MQQVRTIDIRGKAYVTVAERVRLVHAEREAFEMIESSAQCIADRWLWRVVIAVDGKQFIGTAEVKLNASKATADGTNPFECSETSALGRALGFAGLGSVDSIASAEEVMQAMAEQEGQRRQEQRERLTSSLDKASSQQIDALSRLYDKLNQQKPDLSDWNASQAAQAIRDLQLELKKTYVNN